MVSVEQRRLRGHKIEVCEMISLLSTFTKLCPIQESCVSMRSALFLINSYVQTSFADAHKTISLS